MEASLVSSLPTFFSSGAPTLPLSCSPLPPPSSQRLGPSYPCLSRPALIPLSLDAERLRLEALIR